MQTRALRIATALALLFGALVSVARPAGSTTSDSTITYVSEPGDSVGAGGSGTFTPANFLSLEGDAHRVTFGAVTPGSPVWINAEVSPPQGHRLAPGTYEGATRSPFNVGTAPGVSVGISGSGCREDYGRFVVNQVFFDVTDQPIYLDADLEQSCEDPTRPVVRVHALINNLADANPPSATDDAFTVESDTTRGIDRAQLLVNDRDPDPGDAPVAIEIADQPAHGYMTAGPDGLDYTPDPGYDGLDSFTYRATDTTGRTSAPASVTLTVGIPPQDRYSYTGDTDEFVSQGRSGVFTDADSTFAVTGDSHRMLLRVQGNQEDWWIVLAPPAGEDLAPGVYVGAVSTPNADEPTVDVFGNGNGCATVGTFTVNAIGYAPDGTPNLLDADLEQHCGLVTQRALRAAIRYHIPVARPDANTDQFDADGDVSVPSPGVLANDTDADPRNTLTSQLMSAPRHGSVSLAADGAFAYQPAPGFVGDDHFVYRAADPYGVKSVPTIVTMHTTQPPADSLYLTGVDGAAVVFKLGGRATTGGLRVRNRSGHIVVNGTVTVDDGLGGTATVTFGMRREAAPGAVAGTVTIVDPRLGGTRRYGVAETKWQAPRYVVGHARGSWRSPNQALRFSITDR